MTRASLRVSASTLLLRIGVVAVIVAALPYKAFDLDRFFVPKELVLHATACLAALFAASGTRRWSLSRADQLLAWFMGVSVLSAAFATNWWLAERALAITVSGVICFWASRSVARSGQRHALLHAIALASVVGAISALVQAYGLRTEYFSLNRAPGGTFGNRNFMAHIAAIAMPSLVWCAIFARSRAASLRWGAGLGLVAAALMLSRSRAAWLALIVCALVTLPLGIAALRTSAGEVRGGRVAMLPVFAAAGVVLALLLPNTLDWRSDSPYLDTARSVVNYKEGSGRGRLVQYGNTVRMTLRHPLLGVGPGNWPVQYPRFADADDPSLSSEGMTANPWPSSDWMAFLSERGPVAFGLLVLALLALFTDGMRAVRAPGSAEARLAACALLGTLTVVAVVGCFDAVLLLPAPALVAWTALGALMPDSRERSAVEMPFLRRLAALAAMIAIGAVFVTRSASQASAMALFSGTTRASTLEQAATTDPGSYRIHIRLADAYLRRGNCAKARSHASAARALFPNAPQPRRVQASCGR